MGHKRVIVSVVAVALMVASLASAAAAGDLPPGGTFIDDDGSVHEGYIEALAASGITNGCASFRYCPGNFVTRGQLASFIDRALGFPAGPDAFTDDEGLIHESAINRLAAAGIVSGCTPSRYCPLANATRAQLATVLARALDLPVADGDYFDDDDGSVHEDNINRLATAKITVGCGTRLFCPDAFTTRGQFATLLGSGLGLTPMVPPPRVTTTTTTTLPDSTTVLATLSGIGTSALFDVPGPWRVVALGSDGCEIAAERDDGSPIRSGVRESGGWFEVREIGLSRIANATAGCTVIALSNSVSHTDELPIAFGLTDTAPFVANGFEVSAERTSGAGTCGVTVFDDSGAIVSVLSLGTEPAAVGGEGVFFLSGQSLGCVYQAEEPLA